MKTSDFISLGIKLFFQDGVPSGIDWKLQGEIRKGDKFIWEPLNDEVRAEITVVEISRSSEGRAIIYSENKKGNVVGNPEDSFRESCVRIRKDRILQDGHVDLVPTGLHSQG